MLSPQALSEQAVLFTERLRLEQLSAVHFDSIWHSLSDAESNRLTGTQAQFTPEAVQNHLTSLPGQDDRADWAVIRQSDGAFLGEVVLNDLDLENQAMNFRIALNDTAREQGYGTEVTRAVIDYGLDVVGLHRISLSVFVFNPRALRVYEKCGFVHEGVQRDVLFWEGQWINQISMSILVSDPRVS